MNSTVLTATEWEQIIHFSAKIARPVEDIRLNIQHELAQFFGYEDTVFWFADNNGDLRDPINYRLNDTAIADYLNEYHYHDYLHPKKNLDLFREKKAVRLADVVTNEQYKKSPFCHFMNSYGYYDEMVVALLHGKTFVGAIGVVQKGEEYSFTAKDCIRFQYLSHIMSSFLLHQFKDEINQSPLSKREKEVVKLIKKGWTNPAIAKELHISTNTVKKHLQHIYYKYNVRNRTQLVQKL